MVGVLRPDKGRSPLYLEWLTVLTKSKRGWRGGADLDLLTTVIAKLNKKVPSFNTKEGKGVRFPKNKRVQKPLQDVYSLFINSHLFILSHLTKGQPVEHVRSQTVPCTDAL